MATELVATHEAEEGREGPILFQARVVSAVAPMYGEPMVASQLISQQLAGHLVDVREECGDWVRARGTDGYDGWVHRGFLAQVPPSGARQSRGSEVVSLGCITREPTGTRRALPLRALLAPTERVVEGEAMAVADLPTRFPSTADAIAASARDLFRGTSYLWGGVTPWGADCSGLVQSVFALHGTPLPRDAWQQARQGVEVRGGYAEARPADLLFFSDRGDRRVTHVGIALGPSVMVHLALGRGGYAIETLEDPNDRYVARLRASFHTARRVVR